MKDRIRKLTRKFEIAHSAIFRGIRNATRKRGKDGTRVAPRLRVAFPKRATSIVARWVSNAGRFNWPVGSRPFALARYEGL